MNTNDASAVGKSVDILVGEYTGTSGTIYNHRKNVDTKKTEYELRAGSEVLGWFPEEHIRVRKP
jgi:hypothetical protein